METTFFNKYKYKYDMHVHTSPVSTCADFTAKDTVDFYAQLGFCGFVLTNHFNTEVMGDYNNKNDFVSYYLNDYTKAREYGKMLGINVMLGLEIRFLQNKNDYLVYGISPSDVYKAYDYLYSDYETFYKEFKNDDNLIVQAHPFRKLCELERLDMLDGIEVFNMHPNHNSRIAVAAKVVKENANLVITGGTDFHHEGHQGMCALCSKEKIPDSYELASIVKSRDFIFDIWGNKIIPNQL